MLYTVIISIAVASTTFFITRYLYWQKINIDIISLRCRSIEEFTSLMHKTVRKIEHFEKENPKELSKRISENKDLIEAIDKKNTNAINILMKKLNDKDNQ